MLGSMKSVKMMGLSPLLTDTLQGQRIRELDLSKHFRIMGLWRMMLGKSFDALFTVVILIKQHFSPQLSGHSHVSLFMLSKRQREELLS